MNHRAAERYVWSALIILCVSMSLLPLLSSGYYSDDLVLSTLKGQVELQNISLVQRLLIEFRNDITYLGRLDPVHVLARLPISYVFYDVHLNKLVILSTILVNVLMFGGLIRIITRDRHLAYLAMLCLPILFQLRLYHDPILSFSGRMQIFLSFILGSMISLYKYLEHKRPSHLIVSLALYNLALYFYEVSILLVPLFPIVVASRLGGTEIKNMMKTLVPYAISVMVALGAMFAARQLQAPDVPGYSGLMINIEPVRVLKTFLLQLLSSVPLSYYAGNPSRLFDHRFSTLIANAAWEDIAVLVLFSASCLAILAKLNCVHRIRVLFYLGSALMLLPAMVVSISLKYQKELLFYGPGMGYVPTYIQCYGTAFVMTGGILLTLRHLSNSNARVLAHIVIVVMLSTMMLLNMQSNRLVVERANLDLHYRRAALVRALSQNILEDVPQHANLYILDEYTFDPFPFVKSALRSWAAGYQWKNEALVYLYARKRVHLINDANGLRSYARPRSSTDAGASRDVYMLSIKSYPEEWGTKEGYVVLGRVRDIYTDTAGKIQIESSLLRYSLPPKR